MKIYLVGGAVRDRLLQRPVHERDWVVVGGTPEALEAQGFRRVGADFPVFLHPETGEEYALARTERKTAPGYHGFSVYAGSDVSLEDDLQRRDLTINAMAEDDDGHIIDPWGGQQDLRDRLLRHVADAFREDPLRVLRVARFAARFHSLGFRIAPDTLQMMREISAADELAALAPERIWKETARALGEERPDIFFRVLRDCDALQCIFPELEQLFGVPQPPEWHPEIDTGVHVLLALNIAAQLTDSVPVRFAALMHDLGKGLTPPSDWPHHIGHEESGIALIKALCRRLAVPNNCRDLAILAARYHTHVHRAATLRPATLLKVLEGSDAFRRPARLGDLLLACEADARGRSGYENSGYPQAEVLRIAQTAAQGVDSAELTARGLSGPAFGAALRQERIRAIATAIAPLRNSGAA